MTDFRLVPNFQIQVPSELEGGVYSNLAAIWHTAYEFTIDFAVILPADQPSETVPCKVVTRVKIPVTLIFDLLRALNTNMTVYEKKFGEIKRPEAVADETGGGDEPQAS